MITLMGDSVISLWLFQGFSSPKHSHRFISKLTGDFAWKKLSSQGLHVRR